MTTTLITGANKGLGRETARRLIELGHTVVVGARDPELGAAAAEALGARFVPIDVTDDASVAAAAADVEEHEGSIDVLINNAGLHGPHGDPSELTGADMLGVFDVNVAGVVRTTTAFLPLRRRSSDPVIINVSSAMGSLAATHHPSRAESGVVAPVYTSSKAALTMLTTQYAKALTSIRINAADPGYTATDLNGLAAVRAQVDITGVLPRLDPAAVHLERDSPHHARPPAARHRGRPHRRCRAHTPPGRGCGHGDAGVVPGPSRSGVRSCPSSLS